ncbi:MAG TPA: hypothetical protein VGI34_03890 [Candidatus Acidoferrales bacterium]|jgi:hypothetical protein
MFVPCAVIVTAGETPDPAGAVFGVTEVRVGAGNGPVKVEIVIGKEFDVPREFATVIEAVPGIAVFTAGIEAVSLVALTKVVDCAVPFQFTVASLLKFVPFTVSVNPCALQYGVLFAEVVEAETDVIAGGALGTELIVNITTFDISVVVVLLTFVAVWAEPGICTATCTVPGVARRDAGTMAVSCMELTRVVCSAVPLHSSNAPETKPPPLAVIVKVCAPAVTALGLTKVSVEEDVWMERFVLYWEQAEASPQATSATISHFLEYIRTRSSRANLSISEHRKTIKELSGRREIQ